MGIHVVQDVRVSSKRGTDTSYSDDMIASPAYSKAPADRYM